MATAGLPQLSSFLPEGFRMEQQRKLAEAIAFGASKQAATQALGVGSGMLPPGMGAAPPLGGTGMTPPPAMGMAPPMGGLNAPAPGGMGSSPGLMPPMGGAPVGAMSPGPAATPPQVFARGGQVRQANVPNVPNVPGGTGAGVPDVPPGSGQPPGPLTPDQLVAYVQAMLDARARGEDPASVPPPGGGSDASDVGSVVSGLGDLGGVPAPTPMGATAEPDDEPTEADMSALEEAALREPVPPAFMKWLAAGDPGTPSDFTADMLDLHQTDPALDAKLYQVAKGVAERQPDSLPPELLRVLRVRKAEPVRAGRRVVDTSALLPPGYRKGAA